MNKSQGNQLLGSIRLFMSNHITSTAAMYPFTELGLLSLNLRPSKMEQRSVLQIQCVEPMLKQPNGNHSPIIIFIRWTSAIGNGLEMRREVSRQDIIGIISACLKIT